METTTLRAFDAVPSRHVPERGAVIHDFFGSIRTDGVGKPGLPGPEAFMVEMAPGDGERAHFHDVDQFQLFFGGGDSYFQRRPIAPVLLHYADAFSTYGPFGSGSGTLNFFTLRPRASGLRAYMPEGREMLLHRGVRQRSVEIDSIGTALPSRATLTPLFASEPDHLAAHLIELPPAGNAEMPVSSGAGQYVCVLDGALIEDGRRFGPLSLGWSEGEAEASREVEAAQSGARVLLLQFPNPTVA